MAVNPLLRFGFARPHVFLAVVPGGADVRLAVERFARTHGWPVAASPADADVLVVCGAPSGWLSEAVDVVWGQIPAPRAKVELTDAERVPDLLVAARQELFETTHVEPSEHAPAESHHEHSEHNDHNDHHEHHDHGGHHGHGGMVAGLPMAGLGPDRDGLNLDQLHVSLGPFLPAWPAGLRLGLTQQGDVAGEVTVEQLARADEDTALFDGSPPRLAAGRLDAFAALAEVAGDDRSALTARRLRDTLLSGLDVHSRTMRFAARRNRLLRKATDGVAVVDGIDATGRWQGWLDDIARALSGDEYVPPLSATPVEQLPHVVSGLELGGLRIAVASLIPPVGADTPARAGDHVHG